MTEPVQDRTDDVWEDLRRKGAIVFAYSVRPLGHYAGPLYDLKLPNGDIQQVYREQTDPPGAVRVRFYDQSGHEKAGPWEPKP